MSKTKIFIYGLINYAIRFFVAGYLYMGAGMNPVGFNYGLILTLLATVLAFVLLKYLVKPNSTNEAVKIALVWIVMALILDIITAEPIVHVTISSLFTELQTWTRLLVILIVAPFTIKKA